MPYPESCPECGGAFRNTGTHFTARRNEIGRHVLLELGCQNTTRRFWWDFTTGTVTEEGRPTPIRRAMAAAAASNGVHHSAINGQITELDGPALLIGTADFLEATPDPDPTLMTEKVTPSAAEPLLIPETLLPNEDVSALDADETQTPILAPEETLISEVSELAAPPPVASAALRDAFVRQLQLDRLTMRQMRSWLMADEARRAIEVAAGATEATYERLALILFGTDLPQLMGKEAAPAPSSGMSAEERLELQREKARIRARLRRAAAKAARQG